MIGAFAVNGAKTVLTSSMPEVWLFVLGGLFIVVTVFLPRGLIGLGGGASRGLGLARLIPRLTMPKPRRGDG